MRKTLVNLKVFLLEQEDSDGTDATGDQRDQELATAKPQKDRQKMLRDQGCLKQIFSVMKAPFTSEACTGCNGVLITDMDMLSVEDDRYTWVVVIMRLCYSIIKVDLALCAFQSITFTS